MKAFYGHLMCVSLLSQQWTIALPQNNGMSPERWEGCYSVEVGLSIFSLADLGMLPGGEDDSQTTDRHGGEGFGVQAHSP